MTGFWIAAAIMCIVAFAIVAWPIWRHRSAGRRSATMSLVSVLLIAPIAVVSYLQVSNWNGEAVRPAIDPEHLTMVEELHSAMRANPENVEGWLLLGQSYYSLGMFAQAHDAFVEAYERTENPGVELTLMLAVSMIQADPSTLSTNASPLLEQVLQADPANPDALWYGGWAAQQRGRADLAAERWGRLLAMLPAEATEERQMLQTQIEQLGDAPSLADIGMPGAGAGATADGPSISLRVAVGEAVSTAHLGPDARLFIFAQAPDRPMPLAAINRPASSLPGEFTLSDADSPMGGSLSEFEEVTLVARISASGSATAQPGDLYAQTTHRIADDAVVELTIDQTVQ